MKTDPAPSDDFTPRDNFIYLAAALTFFVLSISAVQAVIPNVHGPVLEIITLIALLIAVRSMRRSLQVFRVGLALTAIVLAIVGMGFFVDTPALALLHGLTLVAFFTLTIFTALRQVVLAGDVDTNCVVGAITIYVMIAIDFSVLYTFLEAISPGAFKGLGGGSTRAAFIDLMYFSFVTLGTVGYGDILPVHPVARILAMMEMVVGQFYIAILVATLVGARKTRWGRAD